MRQSLFFAYRQHRVSVRLGSRTLRGSVKDSESVLEKNLEKKRKKVLTFSEKLL